MNRSRLPNFVHAIAALAIVIPGCEAAFATPLGTPVQISCHLATRPHLVSGAPVPPADSTAAASETSDRIARHLEARATVVHPLLDCRIVQREDVPVAAPRRVTASTTAARPASKDVAAM